MHKRCKAKDSSQVSDFPLVIAGFVILEALFYLFRVNALFPFFLAEVANLKAMIYFQGFGVYFYMTSLWLFAIKYYEASQEITLMLT